MLCDFCHEREAAIYMEQVSGTGQKRKINMCMECALERGISSDPKSIEASIGGLFKELAMASKRLQADNSRVCPVCGTAVAEFKRTGKVGCPECYAIFKADIRRYLERKGICGTYSGSLPERLSTVHSVLNDRMILQNKLEQAIASEDYEKAAMYRDYLKALENTAVSSGEDFASGENC
ncbi:MAG: UvrB/UvrC motif-containing protein [Treponema sp.]|nr:UvrB/UvrC motif-containing protein [Treponema sp.]MBQ2530239.1 UvrB/UvrC motif-containing protein [Treponema sp.]MBQ4235369.1 UvrB/UvrC motif-containing protein [Treponema sp.]MBQ5385326.1 UvrB/UvrC motif-containing protein [Treponema sp.]